MKKILPFCLIFCITIFQLSCKKDEVNNTTTNCPPATYQISGVWTGKYTVNNSTQAPLSYNMAIFPDGTITVKGESTPGVYAYSHGTWVLANNIFTASVTSSNAITQRLTGTYSNAGTLTNASWEVTSSPFPFNSGTFMNLVRVN